MMDEVIAQLREWGISDTETHDRVWAAMGPLRVAQTPSGLVEQIDAALKGEDLSRWLPEEVQEPTRPDTGDGDLDDLIFRAPSGEAIFEACDAVMRMLLRKNIAYGNSALSPVRVFSESGSEEQLLVRIDDKINRIAHGQGFPGDNDVDDLIGYLLLLKVARAS